MLCCQHVQRIINVKIAIEICDKPLRDKWCLVHQSESLSYLKKCWNPVNSFYSFWVMSTVRRCLRFHHLFDRCPGKTKGMRPWSSPTHFCKTFTFVQSWQDTWNVRAPYPLPYCQVEHVFKTHQFNIVHTDTPDVSSCSGTSCPSDGLSMATWELHHLRCKPKRQQDHGRMSRTGDTILGISHCWTY